MKKMILIGLLGLSGLAIACEHYANNSTPPAAVPAVTPLASPSMMPPPTRTVTNTRSVENKDGSTTIITTYSDGTQSEERTFKGGQLARVRRSTDAAGKRTAHVTYREDKREVELQDKSWVDKAMDATSNTLATAAHKTKRAAIEVGDKAEDVGDAMKKGAKKVTKKVKGAVK